jgi:hypothetical protein
MRNNDPNVFPCVEGGVHRWEADIRIDFYARQIIVPPTPTSLRNSTLFTKDGPKVSITGNVTLEPSPRGGIFAQPGDAFRVVALNPVMQSPAVHPGQMRCARPIHPFQGVSDRLSRALTRPSRSRRAVGATPPNRCHHGSATQGLWILPNHNICYSRSAFDATLLASSASNQVGIISRRKLQLDVNTAWVGLQPCVNESF